MRELLFWLGTLFMIFDYSTPEPSRSYDNTVEYRNAHLAKVIIERTGWYIERDRFGKDHTVWPKTIDLVRAQNGLWNVSDRGEVLNLDAIYVQFGGRVTQLSLLLTSGQEMKNTGTEFSGRSPYSILDP